MIIIEYKKYGANAPYFLEKARLRIIKAEKVDLMNVVSGFATRQK